MTVAETRAKEKADREGYREAAKAICTRLAPVVTIGVATHAHVHTMTDGAFVEVTLWVPLDARDALEQRKPKKG